MAYIFITKEKTNWKYLLIIFILGIIIGAGTLWLTSKQKVSPAELPEIKKQEKVEDETTNWKTYRNEEYKYTIKYPQNWKIEEAKIEGPENIKSVICFGPQDKIYYFGSGRINPACIEVSIGTLEQYRKVYPEEVAIERKEVVISGYPVLVERRGYDELFYIFEHPTNKNTRVTIRDYINMITNINITERNDLKNIFDQMLSTFRFLE